LLHAMGNNHSPSFAFIKGAVIPVGEPVLLHPDVDGTA
jgi:hypothetical protein